jgi:hypothetical protein
MSLQSPTINPNPLAHFNDGAVARIGGVEKPVPLAATRIDVRIRGGLATVSTQRSFRNREDESIEATMTFPVPVDAVLHALSARIDGRHLVAAARARGAARAAYEEALDRGKAAVLHEELMRGIHMLSVGRVRPGGEVVVTSVWTAPLTFAGDMPTLRIPTTVGEIYGRSPLADCDDLVTGGAPQVATVSVICDDGIATLQGGNASADGSHTISLDRPIDIAVSGLVLRKLEGMAADGRTVTLEVQPLPLSENALDVDLLVDRSGSMGTVASGDAEAHRATTFDVMTAGLEAIADRLQSADRIRLFAFNDSVQLIGTAEGSKPFRQLIRQIRAPDGGTETSGALSAVVANPSSRNVVIVTDGQTYALDVQQFARCGLRITAVLVGEDALDANVSNLAGVTGGQVFVCTGRDTDAAILAALNAARLPYRAMEPISGAPVSVTGYRRGARITAAWGGTAAASVDADPRAIGAYAALLALPAMADAEAAKLAEAEGLVCHLTSLVLVDEAGEAQQGIPATRKVALATPRVAAAQAPAMEIVSKMSSAPGRTVTHSFMAAPAFKPKVQASDTSGSNLLGQISELVPQRHPRQPSATTVSLAQAAARIDWDEHPDLLRQGDLSGLDANVADLIRAAAKLPAISAFAARHAIDPVTAVIGLLARRAATASRAASRLARAILGSVGEQEADQMASCLGL